MNNLESIVKILTEKKETIATMESCTGGTLAGMITNIEGASSVFQYGAVTYSTEAKIKIGVPKELIDTHTVYSKEVAYSMAKTICEYANSDYGIGITGKLNRNDESNETTSEDNKVYYVIYFKKDNSHILKEVTVTPNTRENMKQEVIESLLTELLLNIK